MSTMRFNYRSQILGYYLDITVVLPTDNMSFCGVEEQMRLNPRLTAENARPQYKPGMKFQTVYFMHGGGDEDSLVTRYTNAERYAQDNCVMLVIPNVVHSFGAHALYGRDYSTFITEELPVVIQSLFPSSPEREDNFIMGYAMGGNAALGNAFIKPENYAMCVDISGGIGYTLDTDRMVRDLTGPHHLAEYNSCFGPAETFPGSVNDIGAIAEKAVADGVELPFFTVICGSEEMIRQRVEGDVRRLQELGIPHKYIVAEGYTHNFDMWEDWTRKTLDEILPLKRKPIYE